MRGKTNLKASVLAAALSLAIASTTFAARIIYVDGNGPADFNNIQAAIDYSNDGDIVIVAKGRYLENINFGGKNITLTSTKPSDPSVVASTIIDGRQVASVVIFELDEDTNCVLDGFTITNGRAKYGGAVRCFNSSPTLKNCVFVHNFAEDHGGAMFNYNSGPTLTNCTFIQNSAHGTSGGGGAIQNVSSNVILTNCTFNENQADEDGAAMYNDRSNLTLSNCIFSRHSGYGGAISNHYSDLILTDCIFTTNSALNKGGAMINYTSSLALTNCAFVGNSAKWGGALYNHEGALNITNSIFYANSATSRGGAVYSYYHSNLKLRNCIVWANSAFEGSQIGLRKFSILSASHCDIQGGKDNLYIYNSTLQWGDGNIDAEPAFVRSPDSGLDGNWDGIDDDYGDLHLACVSPCLDAGTNITDPPLPFTDLDGNPRIINAIVDMGPYEGPNQAFVIDGSPLIIPEGTAATFTIALACDPGRSVTVSLDYDAGDTDIIVKSRRPLKFNSNNFSVPQNVTLIAAEDQDRIEGTTRFRLTAPGIPSYTVLANELENDVGPVIFVDDSATGRNDGGSWPDAFKQLSYAIETAVGARHAVSEIRIAEGSYKPAEPNGDRAATFQLINNLAIKGGYAGSSHLDPDARDINTYVTILSGDLNGDDAPVSHPKDLLSEHTRYDNSYNVVNGSGTNATAVLDGFTITAGYANGYWSKNAVGAGIYIAHAGPTIINCIFRENYSIGSGGAFLNYHGSPTLTNCNFARNASNYGGAAIMNETGDPIIANCTFNANWANGRHSSGGAINNWDNSPIIKNCTFTQNSAKGSGGAIHNNYCQNPIYVNCVFSGNSADFGGAIFSRGTNLWCFTNCTFTTNSAQNGNALACDSYWSAHPSKVKFTNCILWDGGSEIWNNDGSAIMVSYSNVAGGWPGDGNIDADPQFIHHVSGDYHLLLSSPCINAGDPNYIAGPNETDLDGKPRVMGGRIDMGAYEYSPPIIAKARITPRTINLASKGKLITCYIRLPENYNVADIDPDSILLEERIKAEQLSVNEQQQVAIARFDCEDVKSILDIGEVELTITGQLTDGTVFEARDVIIVINKGSRKSAK